MKKIFYSIAALSFMMTGCVNESDSYNDDRDKAYDVPAATLLADAQKELTDQMVTGSVNLSAYRYFTQYWAETQYITESRFRITTRSVPDNAWNNLYRDVIGNLQSAKGIVATEAKPSTVAQADWDVKQLNKVAILDIQQVYAYQVLVDTFGDVPYSEAVTAGIVLPKYDDDAAIYPQLLKRLNADIANLNASGTSFDTGDLIYQGDVESWRLFANSLKVKIGINLADVNASLAQTTIESAVAAGVITTNSQNGSFNYSPAAPNYNQIYADLVASGRNDFVPASTIVNAMNALNDPRREAYFTTDGGGNYVGGNVGFTNAYPNFSHVSDLLKQPDFPGQLMEAAEVNFYLAEAAARGFNVGGSAESYYDAAITASFDSWGLGADAPAYLANPAVAYTTAAGDYKEKIGNQAWIAYFNRPFESWDSWKRLDYPALAVPTSAYPEAEGQIPTRYTYPVAEQTVNETNYGAASTAIGGDKLKNKVFWDVN